MSVLDTLISWQATASSRSVISFLCCMARPGVALVPDIFLADAAVSVGAHKTAHIFCCSAEVRYFYDCYRMSIRLNALNIAGDMKYDLDNCACRSGEDVGEHAEVDA